MFLLRANLKWCKVLLFYKSAEWISPYGTSRHKVCSPQKSVLFLSDIFFMSSCPSSEVWSKILFACVVRQAEGTHCRAGIHSPQQGWELCTTRLDKQLLFSYCPPPGCKDPAKISSPSQPWMEQCFLVGGWRRFHFTPVAPLPTCAPKLLRNKPCRKNPTPTLLLAVWSEIAAWIWLRGCGFPCPVPVQP